jgi:tRNA threonylcarbamoyl adenosine modification protein YjeE
MLKLINKFGRAIVATSANASYQRRPYKIQDVLDNISAKQKGLLNLIIDAGELPHNEPSTVIDTALDDPIILRQGNIHLTNENQIVSRNEENTQNFGKELWQKYENQAGKRALIFALEGEMGAGKTILTKGFAKACGIKDLITSPTYNMSEEYIIPEVSYRFEHMDAWRMRDADELEKLGLKGMIGDKSVLVIEWADRVADVIRKYNEEAVVVWVKINYGSKENERIIHWGVL